MGESDLSNKDLLVKINELIISQCRSIREDIRKENDELKAKLEDFTVVTSGIENRYNILESRCRRAEKFQRKNNIIIFGLQVPDGVSLLKEVVQKLTQLLGIELTESDINNLYRLKNDTTPTIKIEFVRFLKKQEILEGCHKLKGQKIYISQDMSIEERQDHKILLNHRNFARSNNLFAKIVNQAVVINNKIYTVEQLKGIDLSQPDTIPPYISETTSAPSTPNPLGAVLVEDPVILPQTSTSQYNNLQKQNNNSKSQQQPYKIKRNLRLAENPSAGEGSSLTSVTADKGGNTAKINSIPATNELVLRNKTVSKTNSHLTGLATSNK